MNGRAVDSFSSLTEFEQIISLKFNLNIQIDFFEPGLTLAIRQKLFYRGQFGLTPIKNILISCPLGTKCPLFFLF